LVLTIVNNVGYRIN